jgi:hypothetical protein
MLKYDLNHMYFSIKASRRGTNPIKGVVPYPGGADLHTEISTFFSISQPFRSFAPAGSWWDQKFKDTRFLLL